MHELSIAMSLVDEACAELERLGDVRVRALYVRVGALSGVVKEALAFSFELAAEGTALAGARLDIEEVPLVVLCRPCGREQVLARMQPLCCPDCGEPTPDVVRGRELELRALEVTDRAAAHR